MKRGLNNQIGDDQKRQSASRLRRLLCPTRAGYRPVLWCALGAASLLTIEACSLGEATVPKCNGEDCHDVSACDDGNGYLLPTEACCKLAAARTYELCCAGSEPPETCTPELTIINGDVDCGASGLQSCCGTGDNPSDGTAQLRFDQCMAGIHPSSGTGGGGTGGAGGAATGGGGGG